MKRTGPEPCAQRAIDSLQGWYTNAPRTLKRIAPKDLGVPRIGHFGFFRTGFERSLWEEHLLPALADAHS